MDTFNSAAEKKDPPSGTALLERIEKTRASLDLADAAERKDWAEAARLVKAGGEIYHRDERRTLRAVLDSDDIAVADMVEGMISPLQGTPMIAYTLVNAAEKGNLATIAHIIAKNPGEEVLNRGICSALLAHQKDAADMLLKTVPEDSLGDNALFGLLIDRPAEYERITAKEGSDPDYLLHFLNACNVKDKAAIDRSLGKLLGDEDKARRRIEWLDMDFMDRGGAALHEMTAYIFGSGHLPAIDRFIDAFRDRLMPDFLLMHVALAVSSEEKEVFPHLVDKLGIKSDMVSILLLHGAIEDRRPAARFLMEKVPEAAREANYPLLRVFASGKAPQEFFDALDKGIPLPEDGAQRIKLWQAAMEAGNDDVAKHLETVMGDFTPAQIDELRKSGSIEMMLKAAEISGDWHARGDALFWRAAADGRDDILARIPKEDKIATALAYQVESALSGAIRRGDKALMQDLIARTPWDDDIRTRVTSTLMASPGWIHALPEIGQAPRPLDADDAHSIVKGGAAALGWLVQNGYEMTPEAAQSLLEIAARENVRDFAEHLLEQDIRPEDCKRMPTMIDKYADRATIGLVEKWLRRDEMHPGTGLAARMTALEPNKVFALALDAAYADRFDALMRRAAQGDPASFDPATLAAQKDAYGNNVLDVLGAHGRLGDILEAPLLWRDRDAVAFIKGNAAACYHDQCDFNGLKAALDQLRLKEMGKRAKLGLKGPGAP